MQSSSGSGGAQAGARGCSPSTCLPWQRSPRMEPCALPLLSPSACKGPPCLEHPPAHVAHVQVLAVSMAMLMLTMSTVLVLRHLVRAPDLACLSRRFCAAKACMQGEHWMRSCGCNTAGKHQGFSSHRAVHACRVGTGVNDMERKTIQERLEGNLVKQEPGKSCVPRCYKVTGAKKEQPDVWVKDPSRSITLQVRLPCDVLPHDSPDCPGVS